MNYLGPEGNLGALPGVETELHEGVLTIAFNRPQRHNAIDFAMSTSMERLLTAVHHDEAVRVIVLCGHGSDFCAGLDERDFGAGAGADAAQGDRQTRIARDTLDRWRLRLLRLLPQPVIAMVQGRCHGGAIAVVEACDIVFAAEDAHFMITNPGIDGLPMEPVVRSVWRVMEPRAASLLALTGRAFDGIEATRNGLVTMSFPAAELESQTRTLASDLAAKDPLALRFTKETLRHAPELSWDGVLTFTAAKFAELKALQASRPSSRAAGVESFLAGKSKPGAGT